MSVLLLSSHLDLTQFPSQHSLSTHALPWKSSRFLGAPFKGWQAARIGSWECLRQQNLCLEFTGLISVGGMQCVILPHWFQSVSGEIEGWTCLASVVAYSQMCALPWVCAVWQLIHSVRSSFISSSCRLWRDPKQGLLSCPALPSLGAPWGSLGVLAGLAARAGAGKLCCWQWDFPACSLYWRAASFCNQRGRDILPSSSDLNPR